MEHLQATVTILMTRETNSKEHRYGLADEPSFAQTFHSAPRIGNGTGALSLSEVDQPSGSLHTG